MAARAQSAMGCGCMGFMALLVFAFCTGDRGGSDTAPTARYPSWSPSSSSARNNTSTQQGDWLYVHDDLNVRSGPRRDARILRTLHRGDYVQMGPKDSNGWAQLYSAGAAEGYVYRASESVRRTAPATQPEPYVGQPRRSRGSRNYITGPRGGCYYINRNGNKTYVSHSYCN